MASQQIHFWFEIFFYFEDFSSVQIVLDFVKGKDHTLNNNRLTGNSCQNVISKVQI